ncbi:MAG: universal stress protein [Planctomycetes bacterium]|nr:universal stress protein [Planctomycetota bacterium]
MPPTPSIVVGTDFSKSGNRAVARATGLAEQLGMRLVTTHVVPDAYASHLERDEATAEALETLEAGSGGAKVGRAHVVRVGSPHEELVRTAESEQAHVIVVGVHQSKHALEGLLGSTAERVLRSGHCAVLLARLSASRRYRRVLVPLDLGETSLRLLDLARSVFRGAHFHVVHCQPASVAHRAHQKSKQALAAAIEPLRDRLTQLCEAAGITEEHRTLQVAAARDPRRRIVELAKFHEVDAIAMGTHARSGLHRMLLGSTADYVARAAGADVLVLPPA